MRRAVRDGLGDAAQVVAGVFGECDLGWELAQEFFQYDGRLGVASKIARNEYAFRPIGLQ